MINIDAVIRLNQLSASQGGTICKQMKITATKKKQITAVASAQILLRLLQSIPRYKTEPIKREDYTCRGVVR